MVYEVYQSLPTSPTYLARLAGHSPYRNLLYGPRFPYPRDSMSFFQRFQADPTGTAFESVTARSLMSAAGGGFLGFFMGMFLHSSLHYTGVDASAFDQMSTWEQVKIHYRSMWSSCLKSARSFAKLGCVFTCVETNIQRSRASDDMANGIYAGCITGAAFAFGAGPSGMALSCGGFALFSCAIEALTRR